MEYILLYVHKFYQVGLRDSFYINVSTCGVDNYYTTIYCMLFINIMVTGYTININKAVPVQL